MKYVRVEFERRNKDEDLICLFRIAVYDAQGTDDSETIINIKKSVLFTFFPLSLLFFFVFWGFSIILSGHWGGGVCSARRKGLGVFARVRKLVGKVPYCTPDNLAPFSRRWNREYIPCFTLSPLPSLLSLSLSLSHTQEHTKRTQEYQSIIMGPIFDTPPAHRKETR